MPELVPAVLPVGWTREQFIACRARELVATMDRYGGPDQAPSRATLNQWMAIATVILREVAKNA